MHYIEYIIMFLNKRETDYGYKTNAHRTLTSRDLVIAKAQARAKYCFIQMVNNNKLMKRKALRKHSLHEKTAASVLLKPFINLLELLTHSTDML